MKIINNYKFIVIIETIISWKENVVLKLVEDFGKLQNVTSITWDLTKQISFRAITVTQT